tara:strand:+ start:689 stop:1267 length:579 start_codon:yes stop_codon:yes gene_type:complete
MQRLKDKIAIVSGSYSGIGEATAARLASEGAKVVLANSNQARGEEAAARICQAGGVAKAIQFNLIDEASMQGLFEQTEAHFGVPTILVNNAAITRGPVMERDGPVEKLERENWEKTFDVNTTGTMLMIKAALPKMVAAGGGRSSISDRAPRRPGMCIAPAMPLRKRRWIPSRAMSPRNMARSGCAVTSCHRG